MGKLKTYNHEKAVSRFNDIMYSIGCEWCCIAEENHNTIWNIRDMVAECDYWLSCYTEAGHCRYDDRLLSKEDYAIWRSEKGMLERFIKTYKPFIENMLAETGHCSHFSDYRSAIQV